MNIEHLSPLVTSVAFGGMTGFLIGYAIKKIMKIVAVAPGIFFTGLMYLESQNIVNINLDKLQTTSQNAVSTLAHAAGQIPFVSGAAASTINIALPLTGSAAMGFTIGFMKG